MKRYFIKCSNTATAKNPGFAVGTKHEYWYGKSEERIAKFYPDEPAPSTASISYNMKEYGFQKKSGAMKAYNHYKELTQWENDQGMWTSEVTIEEVEI